MTFAYPLIATYLLTGGRHKEVLGIQVKDINFDRKALTFRPNEDRHVADPIGGYAHRKELEFLDVPETPSSRAPE